VEKLMAAGRFMVERGDRAWMVDVTAAGDATVEAGAATVSVRASGDHEYEALTPLGRARVVVADNADTREVFLNGRVFRFQVSSADQRQRAQVSSHGDQPTAPMPGTVVKLTVKAGDRVERGQVLVKLEAMKMEMPIRASHDGTVTAVHCREGELVQAGARLLEIAANQKAEG
jgi:biotin carboxyl carrier protein